ncbi:hypothetical protein ID866_9208 [Astraeus odoratus]|nr:hypothetical protein ID866_9208 [Astraeus odoratus]
MLSRSGMKSNYSGRDP